MNKIKKYETCVSEEKFIELKEVVKNKYFKYKQKYLI